MWYSVVYVYHVHHRVFVIRSFFLKFKHFIKMSQLTTDCLEEIFEYLENDTFTLYSCLLVNRIWCNISVRILWRIIRDYNVLITCVPDESKEILYKNEIIFSTSSTSKPPIFNYASFCKYISVYHVIYRIEKLLIEQKHVQYKI